MKRAIVFRLLRLTLVPRLIREVFQRRKVTIILYHDPAPDSMRRQLRALASHYNIIPLRRYLDARARGRTDELPDKALVVTFDDGHKRNYELVPILAEHGVKPTVFVCSGIVGTNRQFWFLHTGNKDNGSLKRVANDERLERLRGLGFDERAEYPEREALSHDEIRNSGDVIDYQAHTRFHSILPTCGDARLVEEIDEAKSELERDFGLNVYAISYPNGDYCDRAIERARASGYACGITGDLGFNDDRTDLFRLKRICMQDEADESETLVRATGLWTWFRNAFKGQPYGYVRDGGGA
jgi:peptidoglycan/xylan/chitin deacetylase (PgdA/CDA1 family)